MWAGHSEKQKSTGLLFVQLLLTIRRMLTIFKVVFRKSGLGLANFSGRFD